MGEVVKLITKDEKVYRAAAEVFPGLRPTKTHFCENCQDSTRPENVQRCVDAGHDIWEMSPQMQQAETSYETYRYD